MAAKITRDDVQRMLGEGTQLVDVLPEAEYANEHIRGAINLPLKTFNRESAAQLDRDRPVIVYCYDAD